MRSSLLRVGVVAGASALVLATMPASLVSASPVTDPPAVDCQSVLAAPTLDAAFDAAAEAADVPSDLLRAVSYMQSRWEGHDGRVSNDGGYGMFNLKSTTTAVPDGAGKGSTDRSPRRTASQLERAAELTGIPASTVRSDDRANVCAAAALTASYAPDLDASTPPQRWTAAIARFGSADTFERQVLSTLREGRARTTSGGETVTLGGDPTVEVAPPSASDPETDCPPDLGCEWIPAGYEKLVPADPDSTGNYGNHDKADRTGPGGPKLKYIVIHDTETAYDPTIGLVTDPGYLAWNYTIRSSDGHIANHLDPKDVGWHAGNWYVNAHSIGIEHEGWAGSAGWFTEAMYEQSAKLVRHLAHEHDIPLDRAHIIGHDQVPGVTSGATRNVHWDPGPYWDWEHYFDLVQAPIGQSAKNTSSVKAGDVVEVRGGYADNVNTITGCQQASPGSGDCIPGQGTNFVLAYQSPSLEAPLANDPGWKPNGTAGTTYASDISARIQSGHKLVVAEVRDEWLGVWWAGSLVWVHNPATRPVVLRTTAKTVTTTSTTAAPIFGRAYPEPEAYAPYEIPVQAIAPLEYTLGAGQTYAVSDDDVETDYYYAQSFDGSIPDDRTDVKGELRYYQLWYAHKQVFVKADDVTLRDPGKRAVVPTRLPKITGEAKVGSTLTVSNGRWSREVTDFRYTWLVGGRPVVGATGYTFTPRPGDAGKRVVAVVSVDDPALHPMLAPSLPTTKVRR
ncbi:N-acetylmuramoyl-L-alanine amidase [Mumia sp. zg.B53]|uniref:N-acetylmuramoyl-L-alanine amidase n=1 Tax=Mumia sp. zg.B53 TaxID=2855449 RepID=UPI001C6EE82F|nr:peptidoglycan recognition family protein [Mumia sp. zg.B53]MBW9214752.1 N-acetylmuramoyl-L-alanine amidase [Mumia sp. zg.B53]